MEGKCKYNMAVLENLKATELAGTAVLVLEFSPLSLIKRAALETTEDQPCLSLQNPQNRYPMSPGLSKRFAMRPLIRRHAKNTLEKEVEKDPSSAQPKDLLRIAIKAADEEIEKVLKKASSFKFDGPREKAAFEDCLQLVENAKEELKDSIARVGDDLGKLAKNAPDLNNWLSAVMSYQQTCIDGFPEGKLKSDMDKTFKTAKELTSNSLAMVSSLTSFMKTFPFPGAFSRRLLAKDGLPGWMSHEDRRILKGDNKDKPTPNVTVAKDGSGDFKTISEALTAMPAKYEGRYVIFVKQGIYDETVTVTKKMANITMYGDGSQKTIVTGNKNFADGVQTFRTATFGIALLSDYLAKHTI
ncbi:hypothetical protein OIU76_027303 [Salix suchowensis]|nr:hypothetical protein OIU76_027303 [Salix suchowensis]